MGRLQDGRSIHQLLGQVQPCLKELGRAPCREREGKVGGDISIESTHTHTDRQTDRQTCTHDHSQYTDPISVFSFTILTAAWKVLEKTTATINSEHSLLTSLTTHTGEKPVNKASPQDPSWYDRIFKACSQLSMV